MKTQTFKVVISESRIDWAGHKVTGSQDGTIDLKSGSFQFNDGKLTGGHFVIDTTSIAILDITDPNTNAQFAGHLASDDFFSIEKFPEATLDLTSAYQLRDSAYAVAGNLTIKGITHPVNFTLKADIENEALNATAELALDRTKYDMKFRSGNFFQNLGDNLIYNDFDLKVSIHAKILA